MWGCPVCEGAGVRSGDPHQEAVATLRAEVEFLRRQVGVLLSQEHQRDVVDQLITGGTAVTHGHGVGRILRAVPGIG
jgi:hypothetical protein